MNVINLKITCKYVINRKWFCNLIKYIVNNLCSKGIIIEDNTEVVKKFAEKVSVRCIFGKRHYKCKTIIEWENIVKKNNVNGNMERI